MQRPYLTPNEKAAPLARQVWSRHELGGSLDGADLVVADHDRTAA